MADAVHRSCLSSCHSSLSFSSQLIPVVTKDSTLNLPQDLLLFSSPFLRSLLPSSPCSSPALFLPDCSSSDLNHLVSLLQYGISSSPLTLSKLLVTSRRVESTASMLGLPLSESLAPLATPSPSLPLAPLLSRDSGISSPNLRVRQDLLDQAKQESEYYEEEEDKLTEPRSEEEEESVHELAAGDDMDENIADDLGDIANTSLSLEGNLFKDVRVTKLLTNKNAKRVKNIEGAEEEPLVKKIKREGGRAEDFNLDISSDEEETDFPFYKFSCELCEIALQSEETLFMHMLNDHFSVRLREENKNSLESGACYECYTEFADQNQLIIHLAKKHDKLNKLLEEYSLQRIEVAEEVSDEEEDERSGLEEEENVNLNASERVEREQKYGCTQDLIDDIDQLIGGATQDDVKTGEGSSESISRDNEAKPKVEKEPKVEGSRIPLQAAKPAISQRRRNF